MNEVARLTNITERYLDYIGKDEYEKVTEGPYIRGYISSYAAAIGIEREEALNRFDSLLQAENKADDIQQEISKHRIRRTPIPFSLPAKPGVYLMEIMFFQLKNSA